MIGKPKYKVRDIVKFDVVEFGEQTGIVNVVDAYGIFADNSSVYYDVINHLFNFKHIKEDNIKAKIGEVCQDVDFWEEAKKI